MKFPSETLKSKRQRNCLTQWSVYKLLLIRFTKNYFLKVSNKNYKLVVLAILVVKVKLKKYIQSYRETAYHLSGNSCDTVPPENIGEKPIPRRGTFNEVQTALQPYPSIYIYIFSPNRRNEQQPAAPRLSPGFNAIKIHT